MFDTDWRTWLQIGGLLLVGSLPFGLFGLAVGFVSSARVAPASRRAGIRMTIRTVLAEDQGMVLGAFAALLDLEPDIDVVATAPEATPRCPQ